MRVPIGAMWPPLFLLALDMLVLGFALQMHFWWLAVPAAVGVFVLALDAAGRGVDYRHAVRHLQRGRSAERVAGLFQYSWCGRIACRAAARAVSPEAAAAVGHYYRDSGYRWYHFFPDNTFTRESPFLNLRFWQITLGGNVHAQARFATGASRRAGDDRRRGRAGGVTREAVRRAA